MSANQPPQAPQPYPQQGQYGQRQAPVQYQYTEAEIRAMKECRNESFWYRSLPLMIGGALLTKYLIRRGVLTTKYGPLPKMIAGGATGYFAGIFSYMGKCNEKIMKLENSPLAEMLRQRKSGMPGRRILPPGMQGAPVADTNSSAEFGGFQVNDDPHSNSDIDTSNVKRMDDYEELLPDDEQSQEAKPQMTTTYQELRAKNRSQKPLYSSEYAPQQQQPQQGQYPVSQSSPAASQQQRRSQDDEEFPLGRKSRKNKYGDELE